ncbi:DUF4249 family protein [bacterium]|nr:DUF4249 family protein [bacterium]
MHLKAIWYISSWLVLILVGCTAPYDRPLPDYESELVVEAYVNQLNPLLNYAIITKSLPYYDKNFSVTAVTNATVTLFEGQMTDGEIQWKSNTIAFEPVSGIEGIFAPPISHPFLATVGHYYKLVVQSEGQTATSISYLPNVVPIDSIWVDNIFNPKADSTEPFLHFTFTDPGDFGNYYMVSDYRSSRSNFPFLWGAADRIAVTDDALFNGQTFAYGSIFPDDYNDTVNMYLISIDQQTFNYWQSYDAAQNNGGPFSQPINVKGTFDHARGVFQAMAIAYKKIIIQKP